MHTHIYASQLFSTFNSNRNGTFVICSFSIFLCITKTMWREHFEWFWVIFHHSFHLYYDFLFHFAVCQYTRDSSNDFHNLFLIFQTKKKKRKVKNPSCAEGFICCLFVLFTSIINTVSDLFLDVKCWIKNEESTRKKEKWKNTHKLVDEVFVCATYVN